jgi:dTDP-4-dehydrorhamnose reductase
MVAGADSLWIAKEQGKMEKARPKRVAITGACGNLGHKLVASCALAPWCDEVVALDIRPWDGASDKILSVVADLADRKDRRWLDALRGVDAIVHFAAQNPYVSASWEDMAASIDMTLNLSGAAQEMNVGRFVFASSNHVMGGYKEESDHMPPGSLTVGLPPRPGTKVKDPDGSESLPYPYALTKLTGERICRERALAANGPLTTVAVRVGWCQPGANRPETLNATGMPGADQSEEMDAEAARDLAWFRNMWLSNRDFSQLFERAICADSGGWPEPAIIVNGMSNNSRMVWDIAQTGRLLGYQPADNVSAA